MATGRSGRALARIENALELLLVGRLAEPYSAPYQVVRDKRTYSIRHYTSEPAFEPGSRPPVLLIPPLMVTSEVFDIDPAISGVQHLLRQGFDVWLTDFGSPERQEGGMERTLRDHVLAVSETIDEIVERTGQPVHLVGYSQGGMFVYETAAFRRSEGIASCVTFGAPVDFHGNFEGIEEDTARAFLRAAITVFRAASQTAKGFSSRMTRGGFRALSLSKEPGQVVKLFRQLHDRTALEQQNRRRRFLHGGGFVGFPGPALNDVIDLVLENRLARGGFVIDGRTVSLVDITCPILYFVGKHDLLAARPFVSAIAQAAPDAPCFESEVDSGHFGMIVGHRSAEASWPRVGQWIRWVEQGGQLPPELVDVRDRADRAASSKRSSNPERRRRSRFWSSVVGAVGTQLGSLVRDAAKRVDELRWQAPRIRRLHGLRHDAEVSMARFVEEQALRTPDETFLLWEGRAFSYAQVRRRVACVAAALQRCGIEPGDRVAVLMRRRPSYLSAVIALNGIGAVSLPLGVEGSSELHRRALELAGVRQLITDPETAEYAKGLVEAPPLVLGGGRVRPHLPEGLLDLEVLAADLGSSAAPFLVPHGKGRDLGMLLIAGGVGEEARLARLSNQRWAFSALGGATLAGMTQRDTVYCCTGLDHPTGIMVAVGAALAGGARLALADRFDAETFWHDVRQCGATVVFYSGEMGRELLNSPPSTDSQKHPIRLLGGSGMRADTWRKIQSRFGPLSIVETYGSTEGNALLANVTGLKQGSVGRPVPGSAEVELVRYDFERKEFVRGRTGRLQACATNEPGVLVSRVDSSMPVTLFDGYAEARPDEQRLIQGAFRNGDCWFNSQDVLSRDLAGDYWYLGRLVDFARTSAGLISMREIEEALCNVDAVCLAAVWPVEGVSDRIVGAISLNRGADLDVDELGRALAVLEPQVRPARLAIVDSLPMSGGFRPLKSLVRAQAERALEQLVYDRRTERYLASVTQPTLRKTSSS